LILYTDVVTDFAVGLSTAEKLWNDLTLLLLQTPLDTLYIYST